ncbi:MAG: hypothetical protein JXQ96_09510 [Cyclobacteriaceae bacterium]
MKVDHKKISHLIGELDVMIKELKRVEKDCIEVTQSVTPAKFKSARNLVHYRSFRKNDLRPIQNKLRNLGMSRLARSEAHIMASLLNIRLILKSLIGDHSKKVTKAGLSVKNGRKMLVRNTKRLLGYRAKGRRLRIMVTQPAESASNYDLVFSMVKHGMNCARINCAHDSPETWLEIIKNVKKASSKLNKNVKIAMDLSGPKIRTGAIKAGARVRKFSPERDEEGKIVSSAPLIFVPSPLYIDSPKNALPIEKEWLALLKPGDEIKLTDTRGKQRILKISETTPERAYAYCNKTTYISTGTTLESMDGFQTRVGGLPAVEHALLLKIGDVFTVHKEGTLGESAKVDENGKLTQKAHISCQLEEVFESVKIGEKVMFDDGKISGRILATHLDSFDVKVTRAKEFGSKLKAEKGINFPNTNLNIGGLTQKDKRDLAFVVEHADIVNFSFVNTPGDVKELVDSFRELNAPKELGVILKIETPTAYNNLIDILLEAMKVENIGVMIARGDLAVETGWESIGAVQREILSICHAAHVPVVWATQVLENLAKKGLPSRSEITDTATSIKAECVMLNKGPFIIDAIQLLSTILSKLEAFNDNNESLLPRLSKLQDS